MNRYQLIGQPMDGSRPGILWPLLKTNGVSYTPKHLFRAGYVLTANALMGAALNQWEKLNYNRKIEATKLQTPPVFIIGHWRSGTTLLHNMMAQDERFGYLCNSQALLPFATFLKHRSVRQMVNFHLMPKRPMDDVLLTPEGPQEEEFILASMFGEGAYLGWYFPDQFKSYFYRYGLLDGLTPHEKNKFAAHYTYIIKKIALANGGKPLVLKNPVNTGRIPMLLEQFPDARFIYLQRDCAEVYLSTLRLHTKLIESFGFQKKVPDNLEEMVIEFYRKVIDKYETDKVLIPKEQLFETNYTALTQKPIDTLRHIYAHLNLPDFTHAEAAITKYAEDQNRTYRPASYQISNEEAIKIKQAMTGTTNHYNFA